MDEVSGTHSVDRVGRALLNVLLVPEPAAAGDMRTALLSFPVLSSSAVNHQWCRRCGGEGTVRDTVTRRLAHEPLGWRPTTLAVTIRRCIARSLSLEVPTADDSR
jgi:hypothetical protein